MRTVVEETKRTSTTGGIVDDLSHHRSVIFEEELVANTNLARWLYKHIPQTEFLIELAEQEHLDLCVGLLLRPIQTGRKHLCVIEYKRVVLIEVVEDVTEIEIDRLSVFVLQLLALLVVARHLYALTLTVNNHQPTLVTM